MLTELLQDLSDTPWPSDPPVHSGSTAPGAAGQPVPQHSTAPSSTACRSTRVVAGDSQYVAPAHNAQHAGIAACNLVVY